MSAEYIEAVRASYDEFADDYLRLAEAQFPLDVLGRSLLAAFAEYVRVDALGPVLDAGCGPGHITAHLAGLGVPVRGVDLSPRMVELAGARHPGLEFAVGSMTALEIPDGELGGILAWFSTHHMPPETLGRIFAEFARALAPGGRLLLATHLGANEHTHPTQGYGGHPVSYESFLLPVEQILELLAEAGFRVQWRTVEEPTGREHARILARRD